MDDAPGGTQPLPPHGSTTNAIGEAPSSTIEQPGTHLQHLPSGATLTVRADAGGEEIQLRSANGAMELRIRMTDDGPVVSLHGMKLEIEAADSIAVKCREFTVDSQEAVRLNTGGNFEVRSASEIRMRSAAETFLDGDYVMLNCGDRTGYHDDVGENAASPAAGEGERTDA